MKATLVELATSKKFLVMLATLVVYAAARIGFDVQESEAEKLLAFVATWILAMGANDVGKAKAQIEAKTNAAALVVEVAATPPLVDAPRPLPLPPV